MGLQYINNFSITSFDIFSGVSLMMKIYNIYQAKSDVPAKHKNSLLLTIIETLASVVFKLYLEGGGLSILRYQLHSQPFLSYQLILTGLSYNVYLSLAFTARRGWLPNTFSMITISFNTSHKHL